MEDQRCLPGSHTINGTAGLKDRQLGIIPDAGLADA
jgi:hypothetical protein